MDRLHPLQRAFIEEQACQCGFCGNGMVMSAKALLDSHATAERPPDQRGAEWSFVAGAPSHNRIVRAVHARRRRCGH